eukprot:TRINITY_DN59892_c0_g1_i1.p1 TRINITY_DN59892_c0_g1~~TRINITY_DN59892_c0_g1_i1.p1  ORF type:complete len:110 (+),score=11.07 TRINITY_DN59892_c0_g1_i1:2-331(+)
MLWPTHSVCEYSRVGQVPLAKLDQVWQKPLRRRMVLFSSRAILEQVVESPCHLAQLTGRLLSSLTKIGSVVANLILVQNLGHQGTLHSAGWKISGGSEDSIGASLDKQH